MDNSSSLQTAVRSLNDGWRVREVPQPGASPATTLPWMPAQVPGHIHLDLERAGVIGDPFYRMQERGVGWVDEADWEYETTFTVDDPPACAYLRFNGLDTIAEITLNGEPLGKTDNMFVEHEFPVGGKLKPGENTLRVVFHSALKVGRQRRKEWEEAGNDTMEHEWFMWGPRSFVRKAQYMYGWDWGPEPVACGIWKDVELVTVPVAKIADWRHTVAFQENGSAVVDFEVHFERVPGQEQTHLLLLAGMVPNTVDNVVGPGCVPVEAPVGPGPLTARCSVTIQDPLMWRPNGTGEPAIYSGELVLYTPDERVDFVPVSVGLRTVELLREPDSDGKGESFRFRVNGEDVFIKGANWIPDDSFPSRLEGTEGCRRLERQIIRARDAGFNMLRVWGGGLYESDAFYDLCDRYGILVWQDFPYACAYYPDTGEYAEAARAEAVKAVRRLRNHPSLALWCGNNENAMMFHFKWGGLIPPRYLGEHIYNEVLPAVVAEEDPSRPYIDSSPTGGENPNSEDFGDRHNWNVWHDKGDWVYYTDDRSRFCSEFGFASSCGLAAWDTCLAESDKSPNSPAVRWHDKTRKGYDTYLGYIKLHYPEPQTLADLVYYSQCNQLEALKCGVEHYRRLKGRCWGTLYWQFNDCWPVQSWAVVDYLGEPKAAYYGTKRFYAPVLISLVRDGDVVRAHLTNDTAQPIRGRVTLRLEDFRGARLEKENALVYIRPNGTAEVDSLNINAGDGREDEVYVYARFRPDDDGPQVENFMFLAEPKDLRLADPGLTVDVQPAPEPGVFLVTLTARRFAPYVWLRLVDMSSSTPPVWEDNFFHLRAGKTKTVRLRVEGNLSREEIRARLAIRAL